MIYITRLKPYRQVKIGNRRDGQKYSTMTADTQEELDAMARDLGLKPGSNRYTLNPRQWVDAVDFGATII